jgi:hypothetical protein
VKSSLNFGDKPLKFGNEKIKGKNKNKCDYISELSKVRSSKRHHPRMQMFSPKSFSVKNSNGF